MISDNYAAAPYGSDNDDDFANSLEFRRRRKFVQIINEFVNSNPDFLFIFRHHPSINPRFYLENLTIKKNLLQINRGNVLPWIFSCYALIHSGCTTGMEAELANVPAINISNLCEDDRPKSLSSIISRFQPESMREFNKILTQNFKNNRFDIDLPASSQAKSISELIDYNFSTINYASLNFNSEVKDSLQNVSSLRIIIDEYAHFLASHDLARNSFAGKSEVMDLMDMFDSIPPRPKSRLYSYEELKSKIKAAADLLGIKRKINVFFSPKKNILAVFFTPDSP